MLPDPVPAEVIPVTAGAAPPAVRMATMNEPAEAEIVAVGGVPVAGPFATTLDATVGAVTAPVAGTVTVAADEQIPVYPTTVEHAVTVIV
jgi:hypothetical protein